MDVWEKDVWEFQAKSGSSGSCCLFLYFLGRIAVQEMSGRTPGSPRHLSSGHPRPSDWKRCLWNRWFSYLCHVILSYLILRVVPLSSHRPAHVAALCRWHFKQQRILDWLERCTASLVRSGMKLMILLNLKINFKTNVMRICSWMNIYIYTHIHIHTTINL